jgi:ABC-type uncharacterized transport system permease subunit
MSPSLVGLLALSCYLAAEIFSIAHLRVDQPAFGRATTLFLCAGLLLHFAALQLRARTLHSVPYRDLPDSMSLFAWMLAATYGLLVLLHRERSTGPFLIPLAIAFLAVSMISPSAAGPRRPELSGSLFAFHVTMAILGYAALTLSFVLALLFLVQTRQLRERRTGLLFSRLPALDVLARLQQTSIAVGVSALALATALGMIWASRTWGTIWDVKVVSTLLTIGIYVLALLSAKIGWRGKKSAFLSIAGFSVLLFSYTVVNLFFSRGHLFR